MRFTNKTGFFLGALLGLQACLDLQEIEFIPFDAAFELPSLIRVNDTVQAVPGQTVAGAQSFLWEYGPDGLISEEFSPFISFDSIGTYNVKLRIEKPNGLADSITQSITVIPRIESANNNASLLIRSVGESTSDEIGIDLVSMPQDQGYILLAKRNIQGLYLLRYGPNLDSLWSLEINDLSNNQIVPQSVLPTDDGGFLISGNIEFFSRDRDGFLLKIDSLGNREWLQTIKSPSDEIFSRVIPDDFGNFVVAATISVSGRPTINVLRYTADGELLSIREIEECRSCRAQEMSKTADGGFVIAGQRLGNPLILKLSPNLTFENLGVLNQVSGSALNVTQLEDGKYILAGYAGPSIQDSTQAFLAKFDVVGAGETWLEVLNLYQDAFFDVIETPNKQLLALGTNRNPLTQSDAMLVRFDSESGTPLGFRFVGTQRANSGLRLLPYQDGALFIGSTQETLSGNPRENIFLVQVQADFFNPSP